MKKRKKPKFPRQHAHRKARVKKKGWRKPRGIYSKQREGVKSRGKVPTVGYQQPRKVRGKHPSGYYEVLVSNINDLEKVDPKTHAIRIRSSVGKKKALETAEKAEKMKIKVINKPRIQKKKAAKAEKPKEKKEKSKEIKK